MNELQGPPLIKESILISPEEMEIELARLRYRWAKEFDSLVDLSKDDMHTWTIHYVNLNHNIYVSLYEAHDELLDIEREVFQMKIK